MLPRFQKRLLRVREMQVLRGTSIRASAVWPWSPRALHDLTRAGEAPTGLQLEVAGVCERAPLRTVGGFAL